MPESKKTIGSQLEVITDQIVKIVVIKERTRLIDQDNQVDNISYEESNKRVTVFCLVLATILCISSVFCILVTIGLTILYRLMPKTLQKLIGSHLVVCHVVAKGMG